MIKKTERSRQLERYILDMAWDVGELRPSVLYVQARADGDIDFTEQELRRKIWTLVYRGLLDLTPKMTLRIRPVDKG